MQRGVSLSGEDCDYIKVAPLIIRCFDKRPRNAILSRNRENTDLFDGDGTTINFELGEEY